MQRFTNIMVMFLPLAASTEVQASVTEYTNAIAWQNAVGGYTTIDFTGYELNTLITDQYSSSGVTFTDGLDIVYFNQGFLNDGVGINAVDSSTLVFDTPQYWIAVDFPGTLWIELYHDGQLLYQSNGGPGGGAGFFTGLVSTEGFDSVVLIDFKGGTYYDDVHFGAPIPAPSALALFAIGTLFGRRRRSLT